MPRTFSTGSLCSGTALPRSGRHRSTNRVQQVVVDAEVPRVYNTHVKSSQIIAILKKDGWFIHNVRGSHHQFKHPSKPGKITVPHPKADLPIGTARAIFKQAGLEWKP